MYLTSIRDMPQHRDYKVISETQPNTVVTFSIEDSKETMYQPWNRPLDKELTAKILEKIQEAAPKSIKGLVDKNGGYVQILRDEDDLKGHIRFYVSSSVNQINEYNLNQQQPVHKFGQIRPDQYVQFTFYMPSLNGSRIDLTCYEKNSTKQEAKINPERVFVAVPKGDINCISKTEKMTVKGMQCEISGRAPESMFSLFRDVIKEWGQRK